MLIQKIQKKQCPRCGARMILQTNSRNGSQFWGCARYPKCNCTVNILELIPGEKCPRCGKPLRRIRMSTKLHKAYSFLGCVGYHDKDNKCNYSRPYNGEISIPSDGTSSNAYLSDMEEAIEDLLKLVREVKCDGI